MGILPNPIGCILVGLSMDVIGRKLCVVITFPLFLIGWLVTGIATNVYVLYIGMFINGLVSGLNTDC